MFSSTHTPRLTGERPEILGPGDRQKAALPEQTAPVVQLRPERHAAEVRSVNIGDAVVPGEPLVDERVVGGQQIDDVAILPHDAFEEQLRLAPEPLPQLVVPVGIEHAVRATSPAGSAGRATARRSCSTSASDRGSASMRRTCCSSTPGLLEPSLAGHVDQLVVRNAAPQEERQARRQLEVADAIRLDRTRTLRRLLSRRARETAGSPAAAEAPARCRRRTCRHGGLPRRTLISASTSRAVAGRRYACRASVVRIVRRTVPPALTFVGRQVNTLRMLRESVWPLRGERIPECAGNRWPGNAASCGMLLFSSDFRSYCLIMSRLGR